MSKMVTKTEMTFNMKLEDLIIGSGKTKTKIAEEVGVSRNTLNKCLKIDKPDMVPSIYLSNIYLFAKYFGVPMTYFFDEQVNNVENVKHDETLENDGCNIGGGELHSEATIESTETIKPHSLLNIFEDAIDKHQINWFINYDFILEPLGHSHIIAIPEFIWGLRDELISLRRNQDPTLRNNIINFINLLEDYFIYLGHQMGSEDGVKFYRLRNIDLDAVEENVLNYRRELNKIYALISNGGSLSIFGIG
jgi:DNA-binding XRE family transcriptional regulator